MLFAIAGFAVANMVTTLSTSYSLTIIARLLGGVSAGLLWALLAGYAARMVPERQKGRAIAIAMVGAPLALSLGVPAGTLLSNLIGWRMSFAIMSLFAIALMVWVRLRVPDFPGQVANKRFSLSHVFTLAGVRPVLLVVLTLWLMSDSLVAVYIAMGAWGVAFGGAGTLFQTAIANTAADAADVAQSMLVTAWNVAIASGGIVGGVLLDHLGVTAFAPALIVLLLVTLTVIGAASRHGFPRAAK